MPASKPIYRILSLDGGGIRGLMTAIWLNELEQELGSPLHKHFDLVAGTSTGSILACGVSHGIPVADIIDMYLERGREVFPSPASRRWSRVRRVFSEGVSGPKYDDKGLAKVLKSVFKTTRFGSLKIKPTLVTSYNTLTRSAVMFKNTKANHKTLPVWEICKASSSAPVYFPAHQMTQGRTKVPLVDGGVVANNPTACAIAEGLAVQRRKAANRRIPLDRFVVASFGTGQAARPIDYDDAREWGAVEWAIPIIDVLFDGAGDATDYIARQMVSKDNYFRLQTRLEDAYDDMDNADQTNLNALMNVADTYLALEGRNQIETLAAQLRG